MVTGARRGALREADRQIDTADLLHSLLESEAEVRAAFGEGSRAARLLGCPVQRSIDHGLRRQSAVGEAGAVPVVTEAAGFSPLAAAGMAYARERTAHRDGTPCGVDLLAAIIVDPQVRAVGVLERAGIDSRVLLARLETWTGDPAHWKRREPPSSK